ncbi:cytochrome P450 [Aspergillus varians]
MLPITGAVVTIVLASLIGVALYRLCFDPLAKYPGPALCAISRLPFLYYTATGKHSRWIHNLHEHYGEIVRTAPDEVSCTNPDAWKEIYGYGSADQPVTVKDTRFYGENPNYAQDILRADAPTHARMRRAFAAAFSEREVREQEPLLRRQVEVLVEEMHRQLAQDAATQFNMTRMYNLTSFDIMGEFCFGKPLHMHRQVNEHDWMDTTFDVLKRVALTRFARYWPWTSAFLPLFLPASVLKKWEHNFQRCVSKVNQRLSEPDDESRRDFWSRLIALHQAGTGFTVQEMHSNSQTLMLAGTDTTATLLTGLTYYLASTPRAMEKLYVEIRGAFATSAEITAQELARLPYLNACLQEGLRIFPSAPTGLPRVIPREGKLICGQRMPPNSIASVHHFAASRSSRNFKNPSQFVPERWLNDPEYQTDKLEASQPFSWGPRNCVGKNFAYHEARMLLATVLWHFDISLCEESVGWAERLRAFGTWERGPMNVTIKSAQNN